MKKYQNDFITIVLQEQFGIAQHADNDNTSLYNK